MIITLWCLFLFHAMLGFALLYGLGRSRRSALDGVRAKEAPFLSVIIPARNEEKNIGALLHSLLRQKYPPGAFEVIVVDDRSSDRTAGLAEALGRSFQNFCLLRVASSPGPLFGKQQALDAGIHAAHGRYAILTDADCVLAPEFLGAYAEVFSGGSEVAFGRTDVLPEPGALHKLQAGDLVFLFAVAGGMAGLRRPLSAMGNNMGFDREKYFQTGGFETLGPSLVEDYQLLTAFRRNGARIRFVSSPTPLVTTLPVQGLMRFLRQRLRWSRGAAYFNGPMNLLTGAVLASNTAALAGFSLCFASPVLALPLAFKVIFDGFFFWRACIHFGRKDLLSVFPLWEAYFLLSPMVFLVWMLASRKNRW